MAETYFLTFLQLVLPLTLLIWTWRRPLSSWIGLALHYFAVGSFLLAIQLAGLWLFPPWWTPWLYWLLLGLLFIRWLRTPPATFVPHTRVDRVLSVVAALFGSYCAWMATHAWLGRSQPAFFVELAFPLREGTYFVANGGSNTLVSSHARTLARVTDMQRTYYGQSYGVDLIKVNRVGMQSRDLWSADPASYFIFGDSVVAPCDGIVILAEDGRSDMTVPVMDRKHMAGNHVVLRCGSADVLLAHFRRDSVRVMRGQHVKTGEIIASAGNSGNSSAPHLHIHAQRPGSTNEPLSGEPLPIKLSGRYLVRGDRVRVDAAE